jgi:hypothetical protein
VRTRSTRTGSDASGRGENGELLDIEAQVGEPGPRGRDRGAATLPTGGRGEDEGIPTAGSDAHQELVLRLVARGELRAAHEGEETGQG